MANGASAMKVIAHDNATITGTGSSLEFSLPAEADEVGIVTNIDSGTVAALTVNIQQKVGDTWVNLAGAQTTNTSGGAVAFATTPNVGKLRVTLATVTTPSSLKITTKVVYGKRHD